MQKITKLIDTWDSVALSKSSSELPSGMLTMTSSIAGVPEVLTTLALITSADDAIK